MSDDPDLESAYALNGIEDARRLYARWAETYDAGFGQAQGYRLHIEVAEAFVSAGAVGPILDIGAGTGLAGEVLRAQGVGPIDAVDLSAEMLDVAETKGVYRNLTACDVTQPFDLPGAPYRGFVSAGTFTHGHLAPDALLPFFDIAAPRALFALSVNTQHYELTGFDAFLQAQAGRIAGFHSTEVRIYSDKADAEHRQDMARILVFRLK